MRLVLFVAGFILFPMGAMAQTAALSAPFQIGFSDLKFETPRVDVQLGPLEGVPRPFSETFSEMTFLGTEGTAYGRLHDVTGQCLRCGEEKEKIFYKAIYFLDRPAAEFGRPLVAIQGRHEIGGYEAITSTEPGPVNTITPDDTFFASVWSVPHGSVVSRRLADWDAETGRMKIEWRLDDDQEITPWPQPTPPWEAAECEATGIAGFTLVECEGGTAKLLLHGSRILLVSIEECGPAITQPLVRFELGNTPYYVVKLGLSSSQSIGLLTQAQGDWTGHFSMPLSAGC